MLVETTYLLRQAQKGKYAIGAFNVYNLEGVKAVLGAAEDLSSPVILQIHPISLRLGGFPLVALCQAASRESSIPIAIHLDHSTSANDIKIAIEAGFQSIMADGSQMEYENNVAFTIKMVALGHSSGAAVEAELGRIGGIEDGITMADIEAQMTDPEQAQAFIKQTGIDALAVCIGNVHGLYPLEPHLDFARLEQIRARVSIPLVLHDTSGLPNEMIRRSIELGVCKLNVNTELRHAYLATAREYLVRVKDAELLDLMSKVIESMQRVVSEKIIIFGSAGKA
jgi:tagatose 1,6-diphosphate aldolase GatY/KbaY